MYENIVQLIKKYNTIIIHRHTNPDGDAIGAQVGLAELIRENFPQKQVFIVGDKPKRYGFMDKSFPDNIPDKYYADALAIILDCSSAALIADDRYKSAKATLRIDHHIFCEKIADTEFTDTTFESCSGIIADIAQSSGWHQNTLSAKSLYTGIVTDSGRFRYDSTTSRTFALCSYLTEQSFGISDIYSKLYVDDYANMRMRALFILKIKFTEHNVAYIYSTEAELAELGIDPFAASRGMVGTMSDMRGVDIWANFTEANGEIWAEIRSSKYNINPIAVKYGGGGHAKASGATLPDTDTAMKMLADLDKMIVDEKK